MRITITNSKLSASLSSRHRDRYLWVFALVLVTGTYCFFLISYRGSIKHQLTVASKMLTGRRAQRELRHCKPSYYLSPVPPLKAITLENANKPEMADILGR